MVGTTTCKWHYEGRYIVIDQMQLPIPLNGTGTTSVRATLPVVPAANDCGMLHGMEVLVSGKSIKGEPVVSGLVIITNYDNTYPAANATKLVLSGRYEAGAYGAKEGDGVETPSPRPHSGPRARLTLQ